MASLHQRPNGSWTVRDRSVGQAVLQRTFKTRELALAWMSDQGLVHRRRGHVPGSSGGPKVRTPEKVRAYIATRIRVDEGGCHIWTGLLINSGYGRMTWARPGLRKEFGAHRISYIASRGEIPEGMWVDHLCRNRACVNPDHLEPVTPRENVMRSPITVAAINAAKTHCPQGHEYTSENTIRTVHKNGTTTGRLCRACQGKSRQQKENAA